MTTKMMPLCLTIGALLLATPAFAQELVFTVTNNSADTLVEMYASPSSEDNWGADLMGGQQLAGGEAGEVSLADSAGACAYDLRLVFASGEAAEALGNDLCDASGFMID